MAENKPLGIFIFSALYTVIGAISTLILFLEILDSIRFSGLKAIAVDNYESLLGFILYGCIPILFYSTGVGISMSRAWARRAVIFLIPLMSAFLLINMAFNAASNAHYGYAPGAFELFFSHLDIFFKFFVLYIILIVPAIVYFKKPKISAYFE